MATEDLTASIKKVSFFNSGPHLAPNYVFSSEEIFDFITVKCMSYYEERRKIKMRNIVLIFLVLNCLTQIFNYHPLFGNQFHLPLTHFLEEIVKLNLPSYHQRNLDSQKKV